MKYIFTVKEVDEINEEGEFVVKKDELESKIIEIFEDENTIRFNTELEIVSEGEIEKLSLYKKTNNAFKEIELNKETREISNMEEIIEKWDQVKNDLLYDTYTSVNIIENLMTMSNYFENKKLLKHSLENYGLIPYFRNIDLMDLDANDQMKKELKLYNLLHNSSIVYDVNYILNKSFVDNEEQYEISFAGKGEVREGELSLSKEIYHIMELPKDKQFFVSSQIEGKYIFLDGFEKLGINIKFLVEQMKDLKKYKFAEKNINMYLQKAQEE